MATIRPTLQEIKDRVDNETTSRLDSTQLRRSDIAVFKQSSQVWLTACIQQLNMDVGSCL